MNNNEPKILLTINLEARLSQVREEVILKVTEEKVIKSKKLDKDGNPIEHKIVSFRDVPHQQRIVGKAVKKVTLSEDAVNYMASKEVPDWYKVKRNGGKAWDKLSQRERLIQHFIRIAYPNTFSFTTINE